MPVRILAIDTATEACSAALVINNQPPIERFAITPRAHTQHILPMVDSLLSEAGIKLNSLDALAFGQGPGSFSGVRIGVGIAQGLAFGADLPLIGVSNLAALAERTWRQTGICQVLTVIDAFMGEVYWAAYCRKKETWVSEKSESLTFPGALMSINANLTGCWATAGTGWKTYPMLMHGSKLQLISVNTMLSSALDLLPIALYKYRQGNVHPASRAEPVYLCDQNTKNYSNNFD